MIFYYYYSLKKSEINTDGNGSIKFSDFLAIVANSSNGKGSDGESLREAFRVFDKEGNGLMPATQLRYILVNLGEKLNEEEVDEIFQEIEIDSDGLVNYEGSFSIVFYNKLLKGAKCKISLGLELTDFYYKKKTKTWAKMPILTNVLQFYRG